MARAVRLLAAIQVRTAGKIILIGQARRHALARGEACLRNA
jgi:hypothetical protein